MLWKTLALRAFTCRGCGLGLLAALLSLGAQPTRAEGTYELRAQSAATDSVYLEGNLTLVNLDQPRVTFLRVDILDPAHEVIDIYGVHLTLAGSTDIQVWCPGQIPLPAPDAPYTPPAADFTGDFSATNGAISSFQDVVDVQTVANHASGAAPHHAPMTYSLTGATASCRTKGVYTIRYATATNDGNGSQFFDVSVRNTSTGTLTKGRVWSDKYALSMNASGKHAKSVFYVVAGSAVGDGYSGVLWKWDLNGIDPFGFQLFANRAGVGPAQYNYHSESKNAVPAPTMDPLYPIYFNSPDKTVTPPPLTLNVDSTTTQCTPGVAPSSVIVRFNADAGYTYSVRVDENNDNIYDVTEVVGNGVTVAGTNQFVWNGVLPSGANTAPGNSYKIQVAITAGEVHFPLYDVEDASTGPLITPVNVANTAPADRYFWNDLNSGVGGTATTSGAAGSTTQHNFLGNDVLVDTWKFARIAQATTTYAYPASCAAAPKIGLAKSASALTDNGDGSYTTVFSLVVGNMGNVPLTAVQVVDNVSSALPSPVTFSVGAITISGGSGLTANASYNGSSNTNLLTAATSSLAVGASRTISFPVTFRLNGGNGPYTNTATAQGSNGGTTVNDTSTDGTDPDPDHDGNPGNNSTPTPIPLPTADLAITKTDGVASVSPGGTTTYTVRVTNNGPFSVAGAILKDPQAAAGLSKTLIVCSATPGQCTAGTTPSIAQIESVGGYALPVLGNGQFYEIKISANVTATSGSVANTATIATPGGVADPTPGNNSQTDTDALNHTVTLKKALSPTSDPGKFDLQINAATVKTAAGNGDSGSTSGLAIGSTVSIAETGNATSLANYAASWSCSSASGTVASGSGSSGSFTLPDAEVTCVITNVKINTLTLTKSWSNGAAGDSVSLTIGGGSNAVAGNSTPAATTNATAGAAGGSVLTLSEAFAVPANANNYTSTLSCNPALTINGSGLSRTITMPNSDATCTWANARKSTTLQLQKNWSNSRNSDAITVASSSNGLSASASVSSTANGSASQIGTPGATATIYAGDKITLPAETFNSGNQSDYATTVSCNNASGGVANAAPGASFIVAANENPVTCVYANAGHFADLSISKDDGQTTATPGSTVGYTIVATNNGPSDVVGAQVIDTLPAALSNASWTCTPSSGASCTASGSGSISDTVSIPNGGNVTYHLTATLGASATGTLSNTATVNAPSGITDPKPGNNSATDVDTLAPKADLVVTKTASPSGMYVPGQALSYTITAKNNGPSDANGVSVTDTVPGTVTVSSWTCTTASAGADCDSTAAGTGASGSTNAIALNNVNLPSGATITIAVNGAAQLSATGDIQNTATATPSGGVSCSTPPCAKSSTVTNSNAGAPQLTIDKQATPSTFAVGANGTYSLTVTNTGSASTSGTITVSDPMPAGITINSIVTGSDWNCTASTATQANCTSSTALLPGSNASVINIRVAVAAGAAPTATNTAQTSGGGDATCSAATPPARCSKTITTAVNSPQLDVKKVLNGTFVVGQSTTYTITVTNKGQAATIAGGTIADTIPAGLTIGPTTLPADCSNPSGQQIQCTVPASLATGASHTYTIPVTPTAATVGNNLANTATASGGGDATCPNAGHCSSQTTDTVTAPQLKLTKSADQGTFVVGQTATYTLMLLNNGTAATTAVATITDTIPAGLAIVTPLPADCVQNPAGSQTVQCTVASGFAVNAAQSFAIQVTPQNGVNGQSVTNTASATGGGDPGCVDGTAPAALPARCKDGTTNPVNAPQLKMTKTASGPFAVGVPASYTLKVENTGKAPTSGTITITDVVPGSLTLGGLPPGCSSVGQQVTCTVGTSLVVNAYASFTIPVTPTIAAAPSVSNTATAQGGGDPTCPTTANCKSTIVTTVDAPTLQLSKASNGAWTVGQGGATYTLKVTNASTTTATVGTITVQDAMPNGIAPNWTDPLTSSANWSCMHAGQNVSCTSVAGFSLAANGNDTITLPVDVTAAAIASGNSAQVSNNASVGGGGDPNNGGNPPSPGSCTAGDAHCANTTTTVNTAAAINVVKTLDAATSTPIVAGQTVTYLFTATNSGASTVANYTISDVVPAHTTFAAVGNGSTTATGSCAAAAGTLCAITFASVPANGTATVKASFVVDASIADGTLFIANLMSQPDSCTAAGCTPSPLPPGCSEVGCTPPTACAADDPHCVQTPVAIADMQASAPPSVNATVGTPVSITTTCSNAGPNAAAAPTCSVNGAPGGATTTCTYNGGAIPDPLPVGGTISCLTKFTPAGAVTITLTTTADSSTPDTNTNNNTATTLVNAGQVTPQPDSATTPINTPVPIDVVANDGASGTTIDPASVSVPASGPGAPAHGSVSCNSAGVCAYTPNADYSGTDTFSYTVCDMAKPPRCGTTTVTVAVGPKANDDGVSTPINTPLNNSVSGNDHYPPNSTFTATSTPSHGTLTMNADGSYTYTPAANYSGPDAFTYKVCEPEPNQALCSTATANITIGNGTLTANPDSASTPYATAVTTSVLSNDTTSGAPIDPSSLTVVGKPANGTASCDTSGHCTYTPNAGFSGTDAYTYRVCDQTTPTPNCATAVVTVVVGPQANDDSATTPINTPVNATAASNDRYPPNSTFTATSTPSHGTLTMNADGSYTYTPTANYSGPDAFTYKVCEPAPNQALCSNATVHITVGNGTLSANPDSAQTPFNTPVKIDVLANDSSTGAPLDPSSLAPATPPTHGTVSCDATGCTYMPNPGYTGTDTFTYRICDKTTPTPNCTTATVTVQVGPKANDDTLTTPINTPKSGTVGTNDAYPPGSTFTPVTQPGHGTLTLTPDGSYTYTPNGNYTGTDTFTYKVCAPAPNQNLCSTATVTVTIAAGVSDVMAGGAPTQTVPVNTPVTVTTKCTNNGPQVAVNATCTVTGPVQSAAAAAGAGGAAAAANAAVVAAGTVCTPAMPVAALAVGGVITCTTPFTPAQAGSYTFTTTAASDTPDSNSNNNVAPSVVIATAAAPVQDPPVPAPIDARWMLALMALLLAACAATAMRTQRRPIRPGR